MWNIMLSFTAVRGKPVHNRINQFQINCEGSVCYKKTCIVKQSAAELGSKSSISRRYKVLADKWSSNKLGKLPESDSKDRSLGIHDKSASIIPRAVFRAALLKFASKTRRLCSFHIHKVSLVSRTLLKSYCRRHWQTVVNTFCCIAYK